MYKNIWALLIAALSLNVVAFADTQEDDAEVKENAGEERTVTTDSLLAADTDESEEKKEEAAPSFIG